MALELDIRQRAMLQEMGVHVWLPGTEFAVAVPDAAPVPAATAPAAPAPAATPPRVAPPPQPAAPVRAAVPVAAPPDLGELATADWAALQQAASACNACGLCAGRKHSTLQAASGRADWMVVGDPPDEDEDAFASPFAEGSGVLLDNMLKAVGLRRNNVDAASAPAAPAAAAHSAYVTNVVKCRPPHGAIAQPAELTQCAAYLRREIALVQPKVILAMGRFANQLLLSETPELATQPLGKLRGVVRHYQGIAVVPTYHPKALMRNSADKAKAWADLCLAADTVDALR